MNLLTRAFLDWILPIAAVLAVAIPNLDHPPSYDEVLHYDAALGLIEHGDLSIAQGEYTRAGLYSGLVAVSFQLFGVNDVAARIPSVLASIVWVLLLYNFTMKLASRSAAWVALALLVSAPAFIQITQMCRFYTLHGMFFFVAALCVYAAVYRKDNRGRLLLGLVAAFALLLALHLQKTTLIGAAALIAWLCSLAVPSVWSFVRRRPANAAMVGGAAIVAAVVAILFVPWSLIMSIAMETPYWASGRASAYLFYARSFGSNFGFVWILFPFLAILSYRRLPALTWYCCVVLGLAFLLHTVAGPKDSRYISYAFPFLCIVAGIGLAEMLREFKRVAADVTRQIAPRVPEKAAVNGVVTACVSFLILLNPNTSDAVSGVFDPDASSLANYHAAEADWRKVHQTLNQEAADMPTLVASSGTKALFYIGYYDYELNLSVVYETLDAEEFGIDPRTGGRVIGELDSLQAVVTCNPRGLVVLDESKWRTRSLVTDPVADFIEETLLPVPVPSKVAN